MDFFPFLLTIDKRLWKFGEGNGNTLQYSCLGNPMDGGAWQATAMGLQKNQT